MKIFVFDAKVLLSFDITKFLGKKMHILPNFQLFRRAK